MSSRTKVISEDEPDLKDFGARTKEVFIEALSLPGKVRSGMALRLMRIRDKGKRTRKRVKRMSRIAESVCNKASRLSWTAREDLIRRLISGIEEEDYDDDAEEKWRKELARRLKEIESGRAKFIPAEDVRRHVKARLKLIRAGSTGVTHR